MLQFKKLISGGLITNYYCSSKCKHCVYASSPSWPKDYMTADLAEEIFLVLKRMGCSSIHIGGGEPLLCPESLFSILEVAWKQGIGIEYVETNASWYKDARQAGEILEKLKMRNVQTLLISIDPFHNEYIPFCKVKDLMNACRQFGMNVFPWVMDLWKDLDVMEDTVPHPIKEYEEKFGPDYLVKLAGRYHLNFRGRALQTYKSYLKMLPLGEILENSAPCSELTGIHHFHVDLYGNFVPQSCAGLSMNFRDLNQGVHPEKYPVLHVLHQKGIKGLFDLAVNTYGFVPEERYSGKCHLCYEIRRYLVVERQLNLPDLQPSGHYEYI